MDLPHSPENTPLQTASPHCQVPEPVSVPPAMLRVPDQRQPPAEPSALASKEPFGSTAPEMSPSASPSNVPATEPSRATVIWKVPATPPEEHPPLQIPFSEPSKPVVFTEQRISSIAPLARGLPAGLQFRDHRLGGRPVPVPTLDRSSHQLLPLCLVHDPNLLCDRSGRNIALGRVRDHMGSPDSYR